MARATYAPDGLTDGTQGLGATGFTSPCNHAVLPRPRKQGGTINAHTHPPRYPGADGRRHARTKGPCATAVGSEDRHVGAADRPLGTLWPAGETWRRNGYR